jgi:hypothetical protein
MGEALLLPDLTSAEAARLLLISLRHALQGL